LDASTEIKPGPFAWESAQATGAVSNPAANITETTTLLKVFIFASFRSSRTKLDWGPLKH
jgi:hypothetical protein